LREKPGRPKEWIGMGKGKKITCGDFGGYNRKGQPCQRKVKGGGLCKSHLPKPDQTPKRKRGRPRKELDVGMIERLGKLGCTREEIAAVMGCSEDVIRRNFRPDMKRGEYKGNVSLKRKQMKVAMSGNPTMLVWLGKNRLGQSDQAKVEVAGDPESPLVIEERVKFYYPHNGRDDSED
jgi:hypothetical protein